MIKRKTENRAEYKELVDNFLLEKEMTGKSSKTIEGYAYSLHQFAVANNFLDETEVKDWDINNVYRMIAMLKDRDISTNSVNHYLREVRTFLYWCMEQGYVNRFKVDLVKGQEELPKTYDEDELKKLLKKPKGDNFVEWRSWAICCFVLGTGARASTMVNVKMEDLDFRHNTITFRATKNKQSMVVPMGKKLKTALREYMGFELGEYLFPNREGYKLTTNALKHAMAKYSESRGVDKTSVHGLRHSFAKEWVKNGGDVFKLQRMLGHRTLDMTKKYVRLYSSDLQDGFVSPLDRMG